MKSDILNYLLEANLILLLAGAIYYLLLHREHSFQLKRFYILIATGLAWTIPLLDFTFTTDEVTAAGNPAILLPNFTVGEANDAAASANIDWWQWAFYAYLAVSFIALGAFMYQLLMIWKLARSKSSLKGRTGIIQISGSIPSFSFFHFIFLNTDEIESEQEKTKVIAHERVHAKQWHSADMVLLYLTRTFLWFNPVAWFFKNTQQETHEYLVDQEMILADNKSDYQALLAKMTLSPYYRTGSYFAKSQTLKRINMMNNKLKRPHRLRIAVALVSTMLITGTFACNEDVIAMVDSAQMVADIPENVQKELDRLRDKYPDEKFNYIEVDAPMDGQLSVDKMGINPQTVQWVDVKKDEGKIGMILVANEDFRQLVEYKKSDDGIYDMVEEIPEPVGGMTTFYDHIGENITYPEEAREQGIEGRVFVQFVIDEEGNMTDIKTVKGIGGGCDMEATRVISSAGPWKPGKQDGQAVKVRMILPITFSLSGTDNVKVRMSLPTTSKTMEETVVVGYGTPQE